MTVFMTGFPGFLGSALLPGILRRTDGRRCAWCSRSSSRRRSDVWPSSVPSIPRCRGGFAWSRAISRGPAWVSAQNVLNGVTEAWHLAAAYDLAVARELGVRANVDGTRNVLDALERCSTLTRLYYFSTCYVSGRYAGPFSEDDLEVGAPFNNCYEETKHLAEADVRRRMAAGMPATIYRPSIVVGDSCTGETQKFDGPYFIMQWLLRQPRHAILPVAGDPAMTV
jgi:nucleoside-diphosphate-sugar epimerase